MHPIVAVGLGGCAGSIARYLLATWIQRRTPGFLPSGTLAVNVIGCLLIGILMAIATHRQWLSGDHNSARLLLVTGFLGGFTTFSAFGYETFELLARGDVRMASANIAANVLLGLAAVWIGWTIARAL